MYQVNFYHLDPLELVGPCIDDSGATIRFATLGEAEKAAREWNADSRETRKGYALYAPAILEQ